MLKKALIFIVACALFSGCAKDPQPVYVNNYRQANYSSLHCFDGSKTFSQIIVCQKEVNIKEKTQNDITNKMIDGE